MKIEFIKLRESTITPVKATRGAAGFDLFADNEEPISIEPGSVALIPTGIVIKLPEDYEAQIRPRSGLAVRHGISVLNTPGTVDSDYHPSSMDDNPFSFEVKVILINHGKNTFKVSPGDRIAQMVIKKVPKVRLEEIDSPEEWFKDGKKDRTGGFGSTGR